MSMVICLLIVCANTWSWTFCVAWNKLTPECIYRFMHKVFQLTALRYPGFPTGTAGNKAGKAWWESAKLFDRAPNRSTWLVTALQNQQWGLVEAFMLENKTEQQGSCAWVQNHWCTREINVKGWFLSFSCHQATNIHVPMSKASISSY